MQTELNTLIQKGVIEPCSEDRQQFISNVFLRAKRTGGHRVILDLSDLNCFVSYRHFKMDSLDTAVSMLRDNTALASIDLKDTYFSVPIAVSDRKYLRFRWENKLFQFTCMPNGLAMAPRVFTRILEPVFSHLHLLGYEGFGYIDDTFVIADTAHKCHEGGLVLSNQFRQLGFTLHQDKSVLLPCYRLTFLGYILDTQRMVLEPTKDKRLKIAEAVSELLQGHTFCIRRVARVIGVLVVAAKASSYARSKYRSLERDKILALKLSRGNFDADMQLSDQARLDLQWWLESVAPMSKSSRPPTVTVEIYTDASSYA